MASERGEYLIAHVEHTGKSQEHVVWWNPDSKGYTICTDKAGRYTADQAARICNDGRNIAVPVSVANDIARSTPFYRRSDGSLAKLYDGGPHSPVPNSRAAWAQLMSARLEPQVKPSKPTPIATSRARAIYIDHSAATEQAA